MPLINTNGDDNQSTSIEAKPTETKLPFEPIAIGTPIKHVNGWEGIALGNDGANGVIRVLGTFSNVIAWYKRSDIIPEKNGNLMPVYVINQPEPTTLDKEAEDQRLRSNIQWGVVRGMFLYFVLMIPIAGLAAFIIGAISGYR